MIKSLEVTNHLGDVLLLELASPEDSGLCITDITGIGPGSANIHTTETATNDGSMFNSARLSQRNIVITARLLFKPTVEDVRHKTYKYFPLKQQVKLRFETDSRICEIYGIVEGNDPVIFEQQEYTQISIICPYPYFYSAGENGKNVTVFYGIQPLFEFPFSNESLTEKLIEFGEIMLRAENLIYYDGDADVGVEIYITAIGAAKNITIYNTGTREVMRIDTEKMEKITGSGVIAGDQIIISTLKGQKSIQLLRNGIYTNILNCLDKNSDWFQLTRGDNVFAYTAEEGATNLQFRVENQTLYEGV